MAVNLPARTTQPPVRGVLLDVFETLFAVTKLEAAFVTCGLTPRMLPYWIARVFSDGFALTAAQDYRRFSDVMQSAFLALAPDRLGRDEAQFILETLQTLDPHPDVVAGLTLLRQTGVRVMTLSSVERAISQTLLSRAGLEAMLDGCLSVETVRRWKPAPEPYAYGTAQLGWPPSHVALISAHEWDVHGARRAGLQTGLLVRRPRAPYSTFDEPNAIGHNLPELVDKLLDGKPAVPANTITKRT